MPNTKVVGIIFPYTNPESLRPFVPEIWPNNVFNLSATYDLDLWPKILENICHGVPIRNMYAKFHNDRLRNGWDITLWNFAKTRTNKHTHKQTHRQTDMGITIPRPPPPGGEVIIVDVQHTHTFHFYLDLISDPGQGHKNSLLRIRFSFKEY